ncbi:UPF0182 family protein [Syntrophus sp. (in: bacteria)]|uniref:UPF0182 family membrane protein n=1 Tax=Syntrophus sp. (in: bacteria) TaxID=48412 RepID=UPI00345E96BB
MPGLKVPSTGTRSYKGLIFFLAAFIGISFFWQIIRLLTDWFWFQEVGYEPIFTVTLWSSIASAAFFGALFFVIFFFNLYLADRLSPPSGVTDQQGSFPHPHRLPTLGPLRTIIFLLSLLFSYAAAMKAAYLWKSILSFFYAVPFDLKDPLFHYDIGFFAFRLPLLQELSSWLFSTLILTAVATGILYFLRRSFLFFPPKTFHVLPAAKTHLLILIALLFFLGSFGFWLQLMEVLFTKRGVVFGPGYTDTTTQLSVLRLLMVLSILCGASLFAFAFGKSWRIPAVSVLLLLLVMVIGRGLYPSFIQKFKVVPNEIVLERPYLEHNIRYTRIAYGLNHIEDSEFPADNTLTQQDLVKNSLTIKNIRLWNHGPLLQTYSQMQEIRTYYKFLDVDNDRYIINGEYRQIMLSPREISYASLPSRSWVNEHLTYTHGYGVVMGPVNRISQEGLPEFFIRDIPPVSTTSVVVKQPKIYYGEKSNDYVFVNTKRPEFDYPVGDKNVYSRYDGKGGVPLSFLKKLLFAARFGSLTILLSDDITPKSKIMFYRDIEERIARIVPFIRLDKDPYLVITKEGRLVWFVDGYTTTTRFPYSEPVAGIGNYIRNSLKATVDAYDGTVQLYISDLNDPIIKTYARMFPGVFRPLSAMPADLLSHIRYPAGMMSIQARMLRTYHMEDPQVFYNKEDLWTIPRKFGAENNEEMEPYYTIMKLPEESREEYILLLPFTPSNKDNLSAWMAARCDAPNYGKMIVYHFPKQKLVYGTRQIEARIDQDTEISKQISLWNQSGSQVIRGSLLVIPIEKSLLYVSSLYLAAEKGQLPELKRVIAAYGNAIAMEENLELSLQRIFGGKLSRDGETPTAEPRTAAVQGSGSVSEETDRGIGLKALEHYRRAQDFLKRGNWGSYGEELDKMANLLKKLEKKD